MADEFAVVNVEDWEVLNLEPMGGKPKRWVVHPASGELWLYKEVDRVNSSGEPVGEDWAEKVVSEVARSAGVPAATVELAASGRTHGTISLTVRHLGEDLVHGNELLFGRNPNYPKDASFGDWYTVEASLDALTSSAARRPTHDEVGRSTFVEYLLLDSIVANTDRHHQNWAVLVDESGLARMAPSFDHGSSLGFSLEDSERARRLSSKDRGFTVEAWATRGKSPFHIGRQRQTMLRAAQSGATLIGMSIADFAHRFDLTAASAVIDRVPDSLMSTVAKQFATQVLTVNLRRMRDLRDDAV